MTETKVNLHNQAILKQEQLPELFRITLKAGAGDLQDDLSSWRRLFTLMGDRHGGLGTWACFELLRERNQIYLILQEEASGLRAEVIKCAVADSHRLEILLGVAVKLQAFSQTWPEFYASIIYALLAKEAYDAAIGWHLRLSRHFPPGPEVLGGLMSKFIVDPKPELQSTLTSIYVFSSERSLYDRIIPVLFDFGASQLARIWRKKFIQMGDHPYVPRSQPFLHFMKNYYPTVQLAPEETALIGISSSGLDKIASQDGPAMSKHLPARGIHRDDLVAKWFASTWLSVDFAINFVHRSGLQMIEARSLQALALREKDCQGVAARIAQLERLNIRAAPQTYCQALVFFAKTGDDKLLSSLLHSDVHPDEFDDADTRHMIMANAAKDRDWKREELFQGVEWAVDNSANPHRLNHLLRNILVTRKLGKAQVVVDRMEALKIGMSHSNASVLLNRAFFGVRKHPHYLKRTEQRGQPDKHLDRAIAVARRVASHKIAVPLKYWEHILHSLGRTGRFDELLRLSLEIIDIFRPSYGGLVPVHKTDLPDSVNQETVRSKDKAQYFDCDDGFPSNHEVVDTSEDDAFSPNFDIHQGMAKDDSDEKPRRSYRRHELEYAEETHFIPADLPFTHRQHPVQKLFNTTLQRNIVRWAFDQILSDPPLSFPRRKRTSSKPADFDTACGVRILAILRDYGVLIDPQIVRATIPARIALGQVPKRRHRLRDTSDVSLEHVKRLVDDAWGSEVLPNLPELSRLVEKQSLETYKRYPVLLDTACKDKAPEV